MTGQCYTKYPSTLHLPWSQELAKDDKFMPTLRPFYGEEVVVTEKMDGESTSAYHGGGMHARSLDSAHNMTRDWIKAMVSGLAYAIPPQWRFVFENVAYFHSIAYHDLPSFAFLLSIWDERNVRLSYDEQCAWADRLDLAMPKVLYRGVFDEKRLVQLVSEMDLTRQEGYVVTVTRELPYVDFSTFTAKFVRKGHCQPNKEGEPVAHWLKNTYPNTLRDPSKVKPAFMARGK